MSTQPKTILIYRADAIEAVTIPFPLSGEDAARNLSELDQAITDATETEVGQEMLFVEVSVDGAKTACVRLLGHANMQSNNNRRFSRFKAAERRIRKALNDAGIQY